MVDILHRVGVKAPANEVYAALASREGLAGWWTTTTTGESTVGNEIQFRFGSNRGCDMKVLELVPGARVSWQVIDGPLEWVGTRISFDLVPHAEGTMLNFKHQDWRQPDDFMHSCSTKWATYLLSLKALLETGAGEPYPHDLKIFNEK